MVSNFTCDDSENNDDHIVDYAVIPFNNNGH
jgi:hypothetical protein